MRQAGMSPAVLLLAALLTEALGEKIIEEDALTCSFQSACVCASKSPSASAFDSVACYPNPQWPFFYNAGNQVTVKELYVDGSFSAVPKNAFDGLRSVTSLELQRSASSSGSLVVDPEAFLPFLPASLQQLMLFDAPLDAFPAALRTLSNLRFLHLQRCRLATLPDYAFQAEDQREYPSPRLTSLILIQNGLQSLAPNSLAGQETTLGTLDLSRNQLTAFPAQAIAPMGMLRQLNLDQNPMVSMPGAPFARLTRLLSLSLVGCALPALPDDVFVGLEGSLQWLSLEGNALQTLPNSLFFLRALQSLKLDSNRLRRLAANTFRNLPSLRTLRLDYNILDQVERGVFTGLSQLASLRMSHCQMTSLDLGFLVGSNVGQLDIGENAQLSRVELSRADVALLPVSLYRLNASANPALTSLSDALGDLLTNNTKLLLDISQSPSLDCGCHLLWMKAFEDAPAKLRMEGAMCGARRETAALSLKGYLASISETSCQEARDASGARGLGLSAALATFIFFVFSRVIQ